MGEATNDPRVLHRRSENLVVSRQSLAGGRNANAPKMESLHCSVESIVCYMFPYLSASVRGRSVNGFVNGFGIDRFHDLFEHILT